MPRYDVGQAAPARSVDLRRRGRCRLLAGSRARLELAGEVDDARRSYVASLNVGRQVARRGRGEAGQLQMGVAGRARTAEGDVGDAAGRLASEVVAGRVRVVAAGTADVGADGVGVGVERAGLDED